MRDLARAHTDEALAVVATVMRKSKNERARLAAAEIVLAYGWGKPAPAMPPGALESELDSALDRLEAAFVGEPDLLDRALVALSGEAEGVAELDSRPRVLPPGHVWVPETASTGAPPGPALSSQ